MPQLKTPGEGQLINKGSGSYYQPIKAENMYYNMNQKHRGLALIFNHENYDNSKILKTRKGTNKDRERLNTVLENIGFKVEIKNDLNCKDIFKILKVVSKMDHSNHACLLIVVLTHGDLGVLYAKDIHYNFTRLWDRFTDQNSPTLVGKPRLFFIQACRGEMYDSGITLQTDGITALSENPTSPDFLIAFSTVPEYYSWRNPEKGSWFIQALCQVLADCAFDTDILTMLTYVCQRVALDFESFTFDLESHGKKVIPSIHSTLTRLLIFNDNNKTNKRKNDCCITS